MDEKSYSVLVRIANASESIANNLSVEDLDSELLPPAPLTEAERRILSAVEEWEKRDLEELYDELKGWSDGSAPPANETGTTELPNPYSSYHSRVDWKREYFNTMTDGMLGSYDEFKRRGGDIDHIDIWAGR